MTSSSREHDLPGDGIALFAALVELGVRVTEAMATAVTNPDVLNNATTQILIDLHLHGSRQPSQLATHLGVSRPQITKVLNQLEDEHLIHRLSGVGPDRRTTTVTLTPIGQQVIDAANHILSDGFEDVHSVTQTVRTFLQRTSPVEDTPVHLTECPAGRTPSAASGQ